MERFGEKGRVRLGELHASREVVDHNGRRVRPDDREREESSRRVRDPIEVELHSFGLETRAVVELHVIAQMERVALPVCGDLPALGEPGPEAMVRQRHDEAVEERADDPMVRCEGLFVRVEREGGVCCAVEREHELAAGHGLARALPRLGVVAGARRARARVGLSAPDERGDQGEERESRIRNGIGNLADRTARILACTKTHVYH